MKHITVIKHIITVITLVTLAVTIIFPVGVSAKEKPTNWGLVKTYCEKHYPNYKVVKVPFDDKRLLHRTDKKVVYVENVTSKSKGKYGVIKGKYHIKYNKKVKKSKKVTSYLIYNPKNNAVDDVVAVVDNRKIR